MRTCPPVCQMSRTSFSALCSIAGTWASRCGVDYAWNPNLQADLEPALTTLKDFANDLGQIEADYSRLLRLGNSVAPDLLLTVANRFMEVLRRVCAYETVVTPQQVVQFFQDDRTRYIQLVFPPRCRPLGIDSSIL